MDSKLVTRENVKDYKAGRRTDGDAFSSREIYFRAARKCWERREAVVAGIV